MAVKEGIHAVGQVFVGALGAAIDIDLTLELTALILGGQPFQLMDELITGRFRDDPAGLDSVHQKLQLRQLERPRRHPIAAAAAPAQPDVIAQRVQRVDVAVDALSLAEDALPGQQLHQLRHIQQMLLVGLLLKDMQQRQQFWIFVPPAWAWAASFPVTSPFCRMRRGAGWTDGTSLPACPGRRPRGRPAAGPERNRTGRSRR